MWVEAWIGIWVVDAGAGAGASPRKSRGRPASRSTGQIIDTRTVVCCWTYKDIIKRVTILPLFWP